MPSAMALRFARAIPRLEARERLGELAVIAIGSGHVERRDAQRIIGEWERTANPERQAKRNPLQQLAALGLSVEVVRV